MYAKGRQAKFDQCACVHRFEKVLLNRNSPTCGKIPTTKIILQ